MAMSNATEVLLFHAEQLDQLSGRASSLNEQLEQANENVQSWGDALSRSQSIPDWTIGVGIPFGMVAVGNFGHAVSFVTNIQLGFAGRLPGSMPSTQY